MAINKNKNHNLQITLKNNDYFKLIEIQNELSAILSIDLNKSQTIAFLINNHGKQQPKSEPKTTTKKDSNKINYQTQVLALKDKLNVSYTRLSEILGIPTSTLKKYASGTQQPQGENEKILIDALARYGIK